MISGRSRRIRAMRSDRVDLFWGSVWDTYSRAIWSDRAMFEALEETGRGRVPLAISRASKQQAQEIMTIWIRLTGVCRNNAD